MKLPSPAELSAKLADLAAQIGAGNHLQVLSVSRNLIVLRREADAAIVLRRLNRTSQTLVADSATYEARPFAAPDDLTGDIRTFDVCGLDDDAFVNGQPDFAGASLRLREQRDLLPDSVIAKTTPFELIDVEASRPFWIARAIRWDPRSAFEFVFSQSGRAINVALSNVADAAAQTLIDYTAAQNWLLGRAVMQLIICQRNPVNR